MPGSLGSQSLISLIYLICLQLFSRAFTFTLNQALLRLAPPEAFGTASIQFELLISTILFLSREGFRNALLRSSSRDPSGSTQNVALLPILAGGPITLLTTLGYFTLCSEETRSQGYFTWSVVLYGIAAFLELLSEPFYIRGQNELRFNVRVKAEGTGIILKSASTFAALVIWKAHSALLAFALGQLAYAIAVLTVYIWDTRGSSSSVLTLKRTEGYVNL